MRHPKTAILLFGVVGWLALASWHGSRDEGGRHAGAGFHLGSSFRVLGKDVAIEFSVGHAATKDARANPPPPALTIVSCRLEPEQP